MKTAVTGDVLWIERPKSTDAEKPMRVNLAVKSDKAAKASKVCLDLTDGGLNYLIDELMAVALKRAEAHESAAKRLRRNP